MKSIFKKLKTFFATTIIILIITYLLFCIIFQGLIATKVLGSNNPEVQNLVAKYYTYFPGIQFDKRCSQYDSELFYTMKNKITCRNRGLEFSNLFITNSFGLRDEKEDLTNLKIITLGDSFTLGYGVPQDKTYASLIESYTGKETLNAGISSYGTARESIMFNRILKNNKLPNLEFVIIQYCNNDYLENRSYIENNYKLNIGPEFSNKDLGGEKFDFMKDVIKPSEKLGYNDIADKLNYFGDFWSFKRIFFSNVAIILDEFKYINYHGDKQFATLTPGGTAEDSAYSDFLDILQRDIIGNPLLSKNVKIILFDVQPYHTNDAFHQKVKELLNKKKYSKAKERVILVDAKSSLNLDKDFFKSDPHTNVGGNEKVARILSEFVK